VVSTSGAGPLAGELKTMVCTGMGLGLAWQIKGKQKPKNIPQNPFIDKQENFNKVSSKIQYLPFVTYKVIYLLHSRIDGRHILMENHA
jgi:hypothetical protein